MKLNEMSLKKNYRIAAQFYKNEFTEKLKNCSTILQMNAS